MSRTRLGCAGGSRRAFPRLILAAAMGLLAGCSNEGGVLARVNGEAITVARFNDAAREGSGRYPGSADSARAQVLRNLVSRELLLQAARREGLTEAPQFLSFRQQLEQQTLRDVLFQRLLGGPFPVSDAEARELYRERGTSTRARVIVTSDPARARAALRELARGADFAAVADRYNPPGLLPAGGDLGFSEPGSLLPPLEEAVHQGPVGRVQGPLTPAGEGSFIVRVEERRPNPQPPFEQTRSTLSDMLRQRKQSVAVQRALEALRIEHQITVLPGAAQSMMQRFRRPPNAGIEDRIAPPDDAERGRVLVRYREGVYTLGEAYDDLINHNGRPPNLSMQPTVEQWLVSQTLQRAAIAEASRRHIQDEPEVRRAIRDRLDNHLIQEYYGRHVSERMNLDPEDYRAAYERYKGMFVRLQAARVITLTMRDSSDAAALAEQAAHASNLREAAYTAAAGGRVREEKLTFPASAPVWTRFEPRLAEMSEGEIAGPYRVEGGWFTFQLVEKRMGATPFEALSAESRGQLMSAASEIRRQALLATLLDSLRVVFQPIEYHADRLRRLPWPPASAGVAGS